jgi:NAD(P)-dependent dehydrogenase (short-subunit alcohol dehydrogenase family)
MTEQRVALVTGGARGQGLAIVRRLRRDGYAVAAGDVLVDELNRAVKDLGDPDVLPVELDITDGGSWSAAVAAVEDRFGGLNVLANNAGVLAASSLLEETAEQFERLWRINCLGAFLGIQAATPLLKKADSPVIVNTLSTSALMPFLRHAAYNSSKWAARGLTQVAARELAEFGIRVNAVHPGPIATPMHDDAWVDRMNAAMPTALGRIGTAEDIANVVAMLASPELGFVTGAEVVADGGQGLLTAQ